MNVPTSTPATGCRARNRFRTMWPVVLSLPPVLFWHSHDGRFLALCLFFAACTWLVAANFGNEEKQSHLRETRSERWRQFMLNLTATLLVVWAVFSAFCLMINGVSDFMMSTLALASLIPALTVTPFLTLATRKPFAATVFTLFLVGSMKILGCIVVVLVHGWHADAGGYTTLPWTQPNLLVCLFLMNSSVLCGCFHILGRRKFLRASAVLVDSAREIRC